MRTRSVLTRGAGCRLLPRRPQFDKAALPRAADYYRHALGELRTDGAGWATVRCVFHDDTRASLRLNLVHGGFFCLACGARGGDIVAFHRQRHGGSFVAACQALGAWR